MHKLPSLDGIFTYFGGSLKIKNSIINNNVSAYEQAKKRAASAQRQRDEIRDTTREINNIKSEMHEIKHLLKELVGNQ